MLMIAKRQNKNILFCFFFLTYFILSSSTVFGNTFAKLLVMMEFVLKLLIL